MELCHSKKPPIHHKAIIAGLVVEGVPSEYVLQVSINFTHFAWRKRKSHVDEVAATVCVESHALNKTRGGNSSLPAGYFPFSKSSKNLKKLEEWLNLIILINY